MSLAIGSQAAGYLPDWRDNSAYSDLEGVASALLAWEWLRRQPDYCIAAAGAPRDLQGIALRGDYAARRWNLHRFVNPDLPCRDARPVWRAARQGVFPCLRAAFDEHYDCPFNLRRILPLVTLVIDGGLQRLLLSDGRSAIRLDVTGVPLFGGSVRLANQVQGVAEARAGLRLAALLQTISETARFPQAANRISLRSRQQVLLLRAWDALKAGATQREMAAHLLRQGELGGNWRHDIPSVRSQVQRLARNARRMAGGGFWHLIGSH